MIRIALILATLAGATHAQAADRRFSVTDFERVVVEGPFTVRLVTGGASTALATGSQQSVDAVALDVQGGTLRIRRNPNRWGAGASRPAPPAAITLTTRILRSARVLGTGSIDISGARGLRIDLSVEGSGAIRATGLAADNLSLGLRGSGSMELHGTAETLTADVQGSGSLLGAGLSAETATIAAATSGDVHLTARRAATVTAAGLGRVEIGGTPACTVRGPSAADVHCGRPR